MEPSVVESYATDKRVTKLARDISSATDSYVPRLLLQIQRILDSCSSDVEHLVAVKNQLWNYELYQVLLTVLKHDLNKVIDGWNTAAKLSKILVSCCLGWKPTDCKDANDYHEKFLPAAAVVVLSVAFRLQKKYIKVSLVLEDVRLQFMVLYDDTWESVVRLCTSYDHLIVNVLESASFLQMLLTDDVETVLKCMKFLQFSCRQKPGFFGMLDTKIGDQILDELTYKLSASKSPETVGCAARTLVAMCDTYQPLVEHLCSRYKGLRLLVLSRQREEDRRLASDLQRLLVLVDVGNFQKAELEKVAKSARVIQAWWKSYSTRRKISQADKAISRLQRTFRHRKRLEEKRRLDEKMQSDLEHMLNVQRRYNVRRLLRRQLQTIESLPASEVVNHLANEQLRAAMKIQAVWKGYRIRRGLDDKREAHLRLKSVIRIQRQATTLTRTQLEDLHSRAQDLLQVKFINVRASRKKQLHCEALLARLELDANLLLNAPRLCDVGELMTSFVCHSAPIAARAKLDHDDEMRLLEQPWWRKLGDDYQEANKDDINIDDELEKWKIF